MYVYKMLYKSQVFTVIIIVFSRPPSWSLHYFGPESSEQFAGRSLSKLSIVQ